MPDPRLTYTVPEVARLIGLSRGACYQAVRCGEIPSIRLGRRVLVSRHALMSLLDANGLATNEAVGKKPEDTRHAEL
jgi:excisionase family DNA binding protein